ncbi:MAG: DUF4956 domain-containing protein [Gammaproteobacteria bacterium]|jgi:hypothetical protein|nr:DUF4956 domain-containing protein [Gammaproteobacteria bacterium]
MNISPRQLLVRLLAYYFVALGAVIVLLLVDSPALKFLPFGGHDALEIPGIVVTDTSLSLEQEGVGRSAKVEATPEGIQSIILFLTTTLITTILVMLPITWTYSATRYEVGPSKVFVRTLLLMPICATTVVLLIQDSLALAFGLAALVAAVRFRVALPETIDGVYIFAAICVGLAGGIGYMGVALVMAMIFTLTNAVMWMIDYGHNPIDDARQAVRAAKLAAKSAE